LGFRWSPLASSRQSSSPANLLGPTVVRLIRPQISRRLTQLTFAPRPTNWPSIGPPSMPLRIPYNATNNSDNACALVPIRAPIMPDPSGSGPIWSTPRRPTSKANQYFIINELLGHHCQGPHDENSFGLLGQGRRGFPLLQNPVTRQSARVDVRWRS
jgi:hypothetical protein